MNGMAISLRSIDSCALVNIPNFYDSCTETLFIVGDIFATSIMAENVTKTVLTPYIHQEK